MPAHRAAEQSQTRRRAVRLSGAQLRAVLAGGLVLGFGASATLASWTDDEFATATVTAGTFGIETSASAAGPFTSHTAGTALTFGAAMGMLAPGRTVYASTWVRTESTSVSGAFTVAKPTTTTDTGASLVRYTVRVIASTLTCDGTATGTVLLSSVMLSDAAAAGAPTALSANGAQTLQVCFAFALDQNAGNALQGTTLGSPKWQLSAASS